MRLNSKARQGKKMKLSNEKLEEMFQDGRLIARILFVDPFSNVPAKAAEDEYAYLYTERASDGIHQNVSRHGQRNRSASLIVPDVDMSLFGPVGFLYDADQSTIKAYMFRDAQTVSQTNDKNYYNINIDKHKFEPILSRKDFMVKYREYIQKVNNPSLRVEDDHKNWKLEEALIDEPYNEVLGNFFPQSLVGLVGRDASRESKLGLLVLKNTLSQRGEDLPMILLEQGQVMAWTPNLAEIANLINDSKKALMFTAKKKNVKPEEQLKEFAMHLGFTLPNNLSFDTDIQPKHLHINNQFECHANEILNYLSEVTRLPKGGKFIYGIRGRLLEVINQRLVNEKKDTVTQLSSLILTHEDIDDLIRLLDAEMALEHKTHTVMTESQRQQLTDAIISNVALRRSGSQHPIQHSERLCHQNRDKLNRMIFEFFTKIASLFKHRVVSKRVHYFKKAREDIASRNEPSQTANSQKHTK